MEKKTMREKYRTRLQKCDYGPCFFQYISRLQFVPVHRQGPHPFRYLFLFVVSISGLFFFFSLYLFVFQTESRLVNCGWTNADPIDFSFLSNKNLFQRRLARVEGLPLGYAFEDELWGYLRQTWEWGCNGPSCHHDTRPFCRQLPLGFQRIAPAKRNDVVDVSALRRPLHLEMVSQEKGAELMSVCVCV